MTSPLIAKSPRTTRPVITDTSADAIVTPPDCRLGRGSISKANRSGSLQQPIAAGTRV